MSLGSSRGAGHPGSQDDLEFELFGADPSVVGLPRRAGWRVGLPDGTAAWDKTGPADTDWTPVTAAALVGVTQILAGTGTTVSPVGGAGVVTVGNSGVLSVNAGTNVTLGGTAANPIINATAPPAGVTSVVSGDAGVVVTNGSGPAVTVGQQLAAAWVVDRCRVYAVDGVNGDDTFAGFADPVGTSAANYAAASAAAGLVAKRTVAGLAAIFPRTGNGRMVEVQFAPGTYAGSPADFLNGTTGYNAGCPLIRGTGTVATAGTTAFAGTTADATVVGAVTATGLFAAGYTPAGSIGTSSIQCTRVGGAAPAFAVEPALPLGNRIRWDSATTTAALRNSCRQVSRVPLTDTVQLQTAAPGTPVAGDTFYTEEPGVVFGACTLRNANPGTGCTLVGLKFAALNIDAGRAIVAFCECTDLSASTTDRVQTTQAYTHPVLGALTVGGGLRCSGQSSLSAGLFTLAGLVTATQTAFLRCATFTWGAGCAARNLIISNNVAGQNDDTAVAASLGVALATIIGVPHTFGNVGTGGAIQIRGCTLAIGNLDIVGAAGTPCVQLRGRNNLVVFGVISGSTGNTDVGMDLQNASLSTVELRAGVIPTVTGTAGDIRYANQALGVWVNHNFEESYDQACNHIWEGNTNGAAYPAAMSPSVANGVHVNVLGADAAYTVMRSAGASGQVTPAQANNAANAAALAGVLIAAANNGAACLYAAMSGYKVCQFDGAVAFPAIAYLSPGTAGTLTTTVPPLAATNQKLRVGTVINNAYPFNLALVRMTPELIPALADGLP